jgi:hypothetical protein
MSAADKLHGELPGLARRHLAAKVKAAAAEKTRSASVDSSVSSTQPSDERTRSSSVDDGVSLDDLHFTVKGVKHQVGEHVLRSPKSAEARLADRLNLRPGADPGSPADMFLMEGNTGLCIGRIDLNDACLAPVT